MLGAINSISFKGNALKANQNQVAFKGSLEEMDDYNKTFDFEEMDDILTKLKKAEDGFTSQDPENKSKLGILASVAVGGAVLFGLGKKGYSQASEALKTISQTKVAQQAQGAVSNLFNKGLTFVVSKSDKAAKAVQNLVNNSPEIQAKASNLVNKVGGAGNIAGAAAALGGTAYVASVDGNGDGVSDLAQKGVNAYKNAVTQAGVIGELFEALT